jgi:hypothetical protein
MQLSRFIFSLDTELAWGHFDCFRSTLFSHDGSRERFAIKRLLDLFHEYEIRATWCVVGQLFHQDHNNHYPDFWRGKYPEFEQLYDSHHPLLYGPDVIEMLLKDGRHEIGFHGYTHRPFSSKFMGPEDAQWEVEQWLDAAKAWNIEPQSVIFPRNKVAYLNLFKTYNFICYRGEEVQTLLHQLPLIGRGFRRFNEEIALVIPPQSFVISRDASGMVNIPSSRWLFGFNHRMERTLDSLKLQLLRIYQIAEGIKQATNKEQVIHLWAHPYEFRTEADFEKLEFILQHVRKSIHSGQMQSMTMSDLAKELEL